MLLEGGGEFHAEALAAELDRRAIGLSFDAGRRYFHAHLKTLTVHQPQALAILGDVLTAPLLPNVALQKHQRRLEMALKARQENPMSVAAEAWRKTAFPSHPCGKDGLGSTQTIRAIAREDIQRFIRDYLTRDRLMVVASGAISREQLEKAVDELAARLPESGAKTQSWPLPEMKGLGTTQTISMPTPQAAVIVGGVAVPRAHEDFYALNLANHILGGGGFMSQLMQRLRDDAGLVYGVSTSLDADADCPTLTGWYATRVENQPKADAMFDKTVADMASGSVKPEQLEQSRTALLGAFAISADTVGKLTSLMQSMVQLGVPPGYLQEYRKYYESQTLEDILSVSARYLRPERMLRVVVRPEDAAHKNPPSAKKNP
jgi:zinc protease